DISRPRASELRLALGKRSQPSAQCARVQPDGAIRILQLRPAGYPAPPTGVTWAAGPAWWMISLPPRDWPVTASNSRHAPTSSPGATIKNAMVDTANLRVMGCLLGFSQRATTAQSSSIGAQHLDPIHAHVCDGLHAPTDFFKGPSAQSLDCAIFAARSIGSSSASRRKSLGSLRAVACGGQVPTSIGILRAAARHGQVAVPCRARYTLSSNKDGKLEEFPIQKVTRGGRNQRRHLTQGK